jgi:pSer/pThr/pTyr-binding forkhead associated (FHA) protein
MDTTVTGPGTLISWWKVSSPTNVNFARLVIDGVEQSGKISGEVGWTPQVYYLSSGDHALRWAYSNNTATVSLTNGAWVDQVRFTAGVTAPEILVQPSDVIVLQGSNAVIRIVAAATPPNTYQWYHGTTSLGAAGTGPTLTLSAVSPTDAGSYYATISNGAGATNTATVTVTVLPVPPVNNDFANRLPIPDTTEITSYTFGATTEPGEPSHAGIFVNGSVWWKWTAPVTGRAKLSASSRGAFGSLVAAVYTGSALASLSPVASASKNGVFTNGQYVATLELSFNATAGVEYAVALAHTSFQGAYLSLQLNAVIVPSNDDFANRITLSGASASGAGSNANATYETGEPLFGLGNGSVWWTWTAPRTGPAVASAAGSTFAPLLAVSTGSSVGALVTSAFGVPASAPNTTLALFPATSGVPYQISVDSAAGTSGPLQVNVAMAAPDLISAGFTTGGAFAFSVAAPAGARYEIQSSDDLIQWTTLESGSVPASGVIPFTDTSTSSAVLRFYRVILPP